MLDDSYHVVTLDRQRQFVVSRTLDFVSQLHQLPTRLEADAAFDGLPAIGGRTIDCPPGANRRRNALMTYAPTAYPSELRRAERVAGLRLAGVEALLEPAHALLPRSRG